MIERRQLDKALTLIFTSDPERGMKGGRVPGDENEKSAERWKKKDGRCCLKRRHARMTSGGCLRCAGLWLARFLRAWLSGVKWGVVRLFVDELTFFLFYD